MRATSFGSRLSIGLLALAGPAEAQKPVTISDFLETIGGDTSIKTVDGHFKQTPYTGTHRLTVPLRRDAAEIAGYRFFKEKLRSNAMATAERALAAFSNECRTKGGTLEPQGSQVDAVFRKRVLTDVAYREAGAKHFWTGLTAVCSRDAATNLGGFVAAVYDPTAANSAVSSLILGTVPTQTAIYAYRPGRIPTNAMLERRRDYEQVEQRFSIAREEQREAQFESFQKTIEIGTDTNCGTVIQLRGPMVEVALPATRTAPNGQATFWSKRDVLFPPGAMMCSYGL